MVIYITINCVNDKFYVGKSVRNRKDYLGSGKILRQAIKKYGKDAFVKIILEDCDTLEQLNDREVYWIKHFQATSLGYNLTNGGTGGNTLSFLTDVQRSACKQKQKAYWTLEKRASKADEVSKRFTDPKERKLQSKRLSGKNLSDVTKQKISKGNKLAWSENREARLETNNFHNGLNPMYDKAVCAKISADRKGCGNPAATKICAGSIIFECIKDAAEALGIGYQAAVYRLNSSNYKDWYRL